MALDPIIVGSIIQALPTAALSLAAICGGGWALYSHQVLRRLEAARWVQQLYGNFYASGSFDEIRIDLEYRYLTTTAPLIQKRISDRDISITEYEMAYIRLFDNYLNYFENLLYLEETKQITKNDVLAGFDYWLSIMKKDAFGAVRTYTAFGFERLAAELQAEPCRSIFLTPEQAKQLEAHAPSLAANFQARSKPALLRCASVGRSGGGGGLVAGTDGPPAEGRLASFADAAEGMRVAAQLDSILDFDASKERIGNRVRHCVRAYLIPNSTQADAWAYLDREIAFPASKDVSDIEHIVLYGSLRPGQAAFNEAGVDNGLEFERQVTFAGTMIDLGDYPGVKLGGDSLVTGDLFRIVDRTAIERLDRFEHFNRNDLNPYNRTNKSGSLYVRKVVETSAAVNAYVYEFNGETVDGGERGGPVVEIGDWARYLQARTA